jgi:hypothetical protein
LAKFSDCLILKIRGYDSLKEHSSFIELSTPCFELQRTSEICGAVEGKAQAFLSATKEPANSITKTVVILLAAEP